MAGRLTIRVVVMGLAGIAAGVAVCASAATSPRAAPASEVAVPLVIAPQPVSVPMGPLTDADMASLKAMFAPPAEIPYPADNPPTTAKLALGKDLFFEPALSGNGKVACASCHDVRYGFSDGYRTGVGVTGEALPRHTPPINNLASEKALFWDGRAASLEDQALGPIANPSEMGMPLETLVQRLKADPTYPARFEQAFPGEGVSSRTVAKALAVFERSLTLTDTPFDRWVAGDEAAISDRARNGFIQFTQAGCVQCHSGWNFTDGQFHDIGIDSPDVGRLAFDPDPAMDHAFKTPSLRNVAARAPYMHTGGLRSLQEVVTFYFSGWMRRPSLSPLMKRFDPGTTTDVTAFLQSLTSPVSPDLMARQEALDRKVGAAL